jgi:hypothetical protein
MQTDTLKSEITNDVEGDEYDKGLVVEEPEEVEDEEPNYDPEALSISIVSPGLTSNENRDPQCSTYPYINRYNTALGQNADYLNIVSNERINTITGTSNKPSVVKPVAFARDDADTTGKTWGFYPSSESNWIKTATVKMIFTINGKVVSKTLKFIGMDSFGNIYGKSKWGVDYNRVLLNKQIAAYNDIGNPNQYPNITSNYVPLLGDILIFGATTEKAGVITTTPIFKAATNTKPSYYKFKIVEWNAKCTGKKSTKSFKMTNPLQIVGADNVTYATKYFRD